MTIPRQFYKNLFRQLGTESKVPTAVGSASPQAPNRATVWSQRQRPKNDAMVGPRFIEVNLDSQPRPLSAIELLKQTPVLSIKARTVACDGGGLLGHPKVFINLVLAKFADPDYRMIRVALEHVDTVDSSLSRIRTITKSPVGTREYVFIKGVIIDHHPQHTRL
ncbi:hypothetical protein PSACC_03690 [Paramicrosporidium saccamoebae]|uniref:Zinc finger CHCC-type domain-containing protein n=1 Tax=Paramicrosporidium saccamoebae TaxID=1246581 RepID=A0A2H9TFE4_9FUNG|nr:hypothetical protein PSACC_03690 [Paramicrosporidium saccamoebae]